MVIQGEFFKITPVSEHSLHYDLELLYEIKGKNPRQEYKNAGYGMPLETAIRKCIQYALSQKFEVLTLREYLDEFKKIQKDLGLQVQGEPVRTSIPAKQVKS